MKKKLALFDLDGTLFIGNSTFDFIAYIHKNNSQYQTFKRHYRYMRIYNKILFLLFRYDWYKKKSVYFLKNIPKTKLQTLAQNFYDEVLSIHKIEETIRLLKFYKSQEFEVIIFTATLDVIALEVATRLEVDDIYSTLLCYDENDQATGEYTQDLLHTKKNLFYSKIKKDYDTVLFFSDNREDIALLQEVTVGFRVYESI